MSPKRKVLVIPLTMFVVAACDDGATAPEVTDPWGQQGVSSYDVGVVPLPGVGPAMAGGKPLNTLEFDEVPFQPVDGLTVEGVTFGYTVGGVPSGDARYNAFGPGPGPFVQCPCMEGGTSGTLTITFDEPTQVVEFGAALSTGGSLATGFTVDVIAPNGKSRGVFPVATSPAPGFTGAQFTYDGGPVEQLVVTFNSGAAARFAIDNLSYLGGASGPMATGSGHRVDLRGANPDFRNFSFVAHSDGGQFQVVNRSFDVKLHGSVECLTVVGKEAWFAGRVTQSDFGPIPVGSIRAFYVVDNGEGKNDPPDQIANTFRVASAQAWCDSNFRPALLDIEQGNIQVR